MRVDYSRQFLKSASRLPAKVIVLANEKEALFKTSPFHPSLETHKLHGKDREAWAFSVNRKIRIKFVFITGEHALFMTIGAHGIYQ